MVVTLALTIMCNASTNESSVLSFDDAVRASFIQAKPHPRLVLVMDQDGSLYIAKRPVKISELSGIRSVKGLPENPPAILLRAHRKVKSASTKAVFNELSKVGIWRLSFVAVDFEHLHQDDSDDRLIITESGVVEQNTNSEPHVSVPALFAEAVHASLEPKRTNTHQWVVVMVDKDETVSIAGLPVEIDQLSKIRYVKGIPDNPPDVLVFVHEKSSRVNEKKVLKELSGENATSVSCFSIDARGWQKKVTKYSSHLASDQVDKNKSE